MQFGPILLVVLLIWFFIARSMRNSGGGPGGMLGSFGKSRHRISTKDTVRTHPAANLRAPPDSRRPLPLPPKSVAAAGAESPRPIPWRRVPSQRQT